MNLRKHPIKTILNLSGRMHNTLLEAMSYGLTITVSNTARSKILIKNKENIIYLINKESLLKQLNIYTNRKILMESKINRETIKIFTWEHVSKKYLNLYKKCVA